MSVIGVIGVRYLFFFRVFNQGTILTFALRSPKSAF